MKVVVIGGVATGMKAASRLQRRLPEADITVIERGKSVSYGACGFPYYIGDDVKKFAAFTGGPHGERNAEFFRKVKGFETLTEHEVLSIDPEAHQVKVHDKLQDITYDMDYDKLVLGTGSTPVKLPIPGTDLAGIHNFWFPWEVLSVKEELTAHEVKDVVIVGAGFIGMELAEAFHKLGVNVSIVEMQDRVLPQMLDKEMADLVAQSMAPSGINLYLEEKTMAFVGEDRVTAVKTDKREIPAQLVVVAVGVRPNVELAREAGLAIGPTGCIAVNKQLQTSNPDIFAGGDCAENTHLVSGKPVFTPMGSTANKHGRVIADVIAGDSVGFPGVLTTGICQILDYEAGSTGLNEKAAREAGYEFETVVVPGHDRLPYMPGARKLILKLIAEAGTHKLLGAQAVGGGVDKRIDTIVMALTAGMTLEQLSNIDVAYAPPFNGPIDNIATAANVLLNKMAKRMQGINPKEWKELRSNPAYTLVDVRTPGEFQANRIKGCACIKNIPLTEVREQADKQLPDDGHHYVCSCQIDLRGYEAETILRNKGYKHVHSLEGGMSGWPYETEKDE